MPVSSRLIHSIFLCIMYLLLPVLAYLGLLSYTQGQSCLGINEIITIVCSVYFSSLFMFKHSSSYKTYYFSPLFKIMYMYM